MVKEQLFMDKKSVCKRVPPVETLHSKGLKLERSTTDYAVALQAKLCNSHEWPTRNSKVESADIKFIDMKTGNIVGETEFKTNRLGRATTLGTLRKATKRYMTKEPPEFLLDTKFELREQNVNVNKNRQNVFKNVEYTTKIYYILLLNYVPLDK